MIFPVENSVAVKRRESIWLSRRSVKLAEWPSEAHPQLSEGVHSEGLGPFGGFQGGDGSEFEGGRTGGVVYAKVSQSVLN
jgi:hypothetical protein